MDIVPKTDVIKSRMAKLKMRQDELANRLNVTRPYANALINGRKSSWRQAYRLSKELGGTTEDYFIVVED